MAETSDQVSERLAGLVSAGDLTGLVEALAGLTERTRKAVWPLLKDVCPQTPAAVLAAVGCAPRPRALVDATPCMDFTQAAEALVVQVLLDRRPPWLPALAKALLTHWPAPEWRLRVVRALVRAGALEPTVTDGHEELLISAIAPARYWAEPDSSVLRALRDDPELLDHMVWTMLSTESCGRSLQQHDHHHDSPPEYRPDPSPRPWATWRHALVTLSAEGAVDRDRLLDVTLGALTADRAAPALPWFVSLHQALAPTADELAARRDVYLRLPAADHGPVLRLGLDAARRLLEHGAVGPTAVADALVPALSRPEKGSATAAIALLERAAASLPDRSSLLLTLTPALDHPHPDVRERARTLAMQWGSAPVPERPAVLVDEPTAPTPTAAGVVPVSGPEELAELFAHLIEEADDPIEVERALDGVLRLARSRPQHGARALAERAAYLAGRFPGPWFGSDVRTDLAALTVVWLTGEPPEPAWPGRQVGYVTERSDDGSSRSRAAIEPDCGLFALRRFRVHEVAQVVAHGGTVPLSLPATTDGSLPADVLLDRLSTVSTAYPRDLGCAFLRVPPEELDRLLPRFVPGAALDDVITLRRYAPQWRRVVGAPCDLWGRPASPMVGWADPTSPIGTVDRVVLGALDRRDPLRHAALELEDADHGGRPEQVTAAWTLLLPHHPDLLAAHAHPRLARALTKNRSGAGPLLEALGRSPRPAGPPTWSALVLGLAAKETAVQVAAVDAVVARARSGGLDAAGLAEQVRACLADDVVVGTRVSDGLAEVARADRGSAEIVLDVLGEVVPAVAGRRDGHRWVETAAELGTLLGRPVALPPELRALAADCGSSALARACRRALSVG
ncbi:MAG: hypothetical protein B7X41_07390 [Microbacterium sp. 14-71-5]|nr:MAG: hypothetical protein B7X41_07390 [Microbacterium sp. 14-71-5]